MITRANYQKMAVKSIAKHMTTKVYETILAMVVRRKYEGVI
jgi:hypothetical protein